MKKSFILMLTLVMLVSAGITCVFAAEYTKFSRSFVKHFRDCDYYTETTSSEFEGKTFTTKRTIQGWRNGFCRYQESMTSSDGVYNLDCNFSNIQVDELYEAMRSRSKDAENYNLELFKEEKNAKTNTPKYVKAGTTLIKGNKAYITWAKYQNNPYFCKPTKIK